MWSKVLSCGIWLLCTTGYSLQTSSERVNPFNQYLSPSGGVSLFTRDAALSHPLFAVTGLGGISLPVSLSYSSNVHINARSRNDVAPTSWVGLGWNLSFGKIVCDHNGTMTDADDSYLYK